MDYGGENAFLRINSESIGIEFCFEFLSFKYSQNDTFNLLHVFFREVKVSLLLRPSELLVPPLTLRLLAYSRISDSLAFNVNSWANMQEKFVSVDETNWYGDYIPPDDLYFHEEEYVN